MYDWRKLGDNERADVLLSRQRAQRPWHSPPHWQPDGACWFHLTAACYEHKATIGARIERMSSFTDALLEMFDEPSLAAWCVLPNHYHLLVQTNALAEVTKALGRVHGRSSRAWNIEDGCAARHVFHRTADRHIRSEGHFWATLNYIHHNPVRHRYVARWTDWPWSSANEYLRKVGRDEATRIWRSYPVLNYGEEWDPEDL